MIIDSHVHVFPDKICKKTIRKLANNDPNHILPYYNDGSVNGAREKMKEWGIDLGIIAPIATNEKQQDNVINFALNIQKNNPEFITLGTVYPDALDVLDRLDYMKSEGVHGIKLHPDYQNFFIDEEKMFPIYERCQKLELPILFHSGYDPVSPDCIHAAPEGIIKVARAFPDLIIVAAHTGGLAYSSCSRDCFKELDNLCFDTAIASVTFTSDEYRKIIDIYGIERFIFGTDNPWGNGIDDFKFFEKVGLTSEEKEYLFEKNACRIFKIKEREIKNEI